MSTTTTTTRDRGDRYGSIEWAQKSPMVAGGVGWNDDVNVCRRRPGAVETVNYSGDLSLSGCDVGRRCQTTVSCSLHFIARRRRLSVCPSRDNAGT